MRTQTKKLPRCLTLLLLFICSVLLIYPAQVLAKQNTGSGIVLAKTSAGLGHSALINYDGQVYLWGDNTYGQLGAKGVDYSDEPLRVFFPAAAIDISLGSYHSLVLLENGDVYAFGRNTFGQLGNGTTEQSDRPVKIDGLPAISSVAAGALHSIALGADGSVWAWGNNSHMQVGDVYSEIIYDTNGAVLGSRCTSPVRIKAGNVTAIAAGGQHSLYLDSQGNVFAWGDNSRGQLGNGSSQQNGNPGLVTGLENVRLIAAGYMHNLAVNNTDGHDTVWVWGDDTHGQLGIGSDLQLKPFRSLPVKIDRADGSGVFSPLIYKISAGYAHSAAITYRLDDDGQLDLTRHQLWVWGNNSHGQLGTGTAGNSLNRPVLYSGTDYGHYGNHYLPLDSLAAGGYHTLLLSSKGLLAAAGRGDSGQLGNLSILDRASFINVPIPDVIRPAFLTGSSLNLEKISDSEYIVRWPAARDNISVSGYRVMVNSSGGDSRVITVDNREYIVLSELVPDLAYEIIVVPFDEASSEIRWSLLSRLVAYILPDDSYVASEFFAESLSSVYQVIPFEHNWLPAKTGNVQALDVPWNTTSLYGEEAVQPPGSYLPLLITGICTLLLLGLCLIAVRYKHDAKPRKRDIRLTVDPGSQQVTG